jgi:prephenate dehydrogenase
MDMDVLFQPPLLYLLFVMIWWGVQFVPFALSEHDHFMVATGAIVHVIIMAWLVHLSAPAESWKSIILFSAELATIFTGGGYLLCYLKIFERRKKITARRQGSAYVGVDRRGI